MKTTQKNMAAIQTNMNTTLWHELDEKTSETISGGAEGGLARSNRLGDVTQTPRSSDVLVIWVW